MQSVGLTEQWIMVGKRMDKSQTIKLSFMLLTWAPREMVKPLIEQLV